MLRVTILAASALTVLAGAIIAPALPGIHAHFAGQPHADTWSRLVLTLPGLAVAIGAPFAGWWCDHAGRRIPLVCGLVLYAFAGAAGLVVDSLALLLISRALLGIAMALVMTAASALIADQFVGAERGRVLGQQGAAMALGGVAFLILGGILGDWSWRAPFAVYLLAVLVIPGAIISAMPRLTPVSSLREPLPMRAIVPALALVFGAMTAFYVVPVHLPFLLEQVHQRRATTAGFAIASANFMAAGVALTSARVLPYLGYARAAGVACATIAIGLAVIGFGFTSLPLIFVGLAILGAGTGLVMPVAAGWIATVVPAGTRGRAMGLITAGTFLGQFASPLVTNPLVGNGWQLLFTTSAVVIAGLGIALALFTRMPQRNN